MITKVLIVDDEVINVKLIEEILEFEDDFICRSAVDGNEALHLLEEYHPDIVLLDIMMPGMTGYEVCRRIKADKRHRFAKILMISGKAMVEERLEGYEAGADDYITKPFVDDELLAKLKVFSRLKKTEEVDELKTSILQLFSHETNTPLNGILLGSQLILDTPHLPHKVAEYANLIRLSGQRLHDLVRKILLLSSLRNKRSLQRNQGTLSTFLEDLIRRKIEQNCLCRFEISCPAELQLEMDWDLFQQAVDSVLDNAIKHSPENGSVTIEAMNDNGAASLRVSDQGPGIDPAVQEMIFDEFHSQRIENHSQGTALSLTIAREIMGLHQGNLTVDSNPGQGASFLFTLPAPTTGF